MHREKIFMPRKKLCIARKFHTSQKFMHRRNIDMPRKKSCTAREGIVHIKINIYTSVSTASSFDKDECEENHRRQQREISTLHQLLFFWHQMKSTLKIIANTRHKIYLLYVKSIELTSNVERVQLGDNTVKDILPIWITILYGWILSQSLQRASERINSPNKKTTGADDIKKGCSTMWTFFLAAN